MYREIENMKFGVGVMFYDQGMMIQCVNISEKVCCSLEGLIFFDLRCVFSIVEKVVKFDVVELGLNFIFGQIVNNFQNGIVIVGELQ